MTIAVNRFVFGRRQVRRNPMLTTCTTCTPPSSTLVADVMNVRHGTERERSPINLLRLYSRCAMATSRLEKKSTHLRSRDTIVYKKKVKGNYKMCILYLTWSGRRPSRHFFFPFLLSGAYYVCVMKRHCGGGGSWRPLRWKKVKK